MNDLEQVENEVKQAREALERAEKKLENLKSPPPFKLPDSCVVCNVNQEVVRFYHPYNDCGSFINLEGRVGMSATKQTVEKDAKGGDVPVILTDSQIAEVVKFILEMVKSDS